MVPFGIKREHGPGREAEAVAAPATVSGETTPLMITEKPGRSASIVDPRPASQETCHRSRSRSRARWNDGLYSWDAPPRSRCFPQQHARVSCLELSQLS